MPRTRSLAWSELKIGVLTIIALSITALSIFMLTGDRGFFWQRYRLKTRFDNVAGLKSGSPVRVAGKEVGQVSAVDFAGDLVDVTVEINRDQRQRITDMSLAKLGSVSLLGESAVDITASTRGTPIPDWGYIRSAPAAAQLTDVAESANKGVEQITALVRDLRAGRGTAGKLLTDDRLYAEMHQFVATAGELARSVREGRGTVGRLLNDRKTADELEASLKNIEEMTQQINAGHGSLGKLLKDESFANSLNGATSSLQELTGRVNRGEGTAGKLVTDPSLFNRLNEVAGRFDQLVTRLDEGQGTAGQLLKDKQLYENMNGAVVDLRSLIANIQRDPKKYLNVKVSIF